MQDLDKAIAQPFMMMVPMGMPVTPEKKDSAGREEEEL